MTQPKRDPKPKEGAELVRTLRSIAPGFNEGDVDQAAVKRYRRHGVDHADVARLSRSDDPRDRQTARLRAAAMLTALQDESGDDT